MKPLQVTDSESKARVARETALTYRPQAAPFPKSIVRPADTEPYRLAALQYFEAAEQFYQAGDHARGDYSILRGDKYLLLASVATQINAMGVTPLLDEKPTEQVSESDTSIKMDLEAKRKHLEEFLDQRHRFVPQVPAEVANADTCDYFSQMSLDCFTQAVLATEDGNSAHVVDYYYHESILYDIAYQMCEEKIHKFDS